VKKKDFPQCPYVFKEMINQASVGKTSTEPQTHAKSLLKESLKQVEKKIPTEQSLQKN